MRTGQNKRMRGRMSNGRRGANALSRSYESNGPDLKIRGTAHHIGEKYLQLARDAHTSGDHVVAENYLQHAEHYFRLIAAAQAAQAGIQGQPSAEQDGEEVDDDNDSGVLDRFASPLERLPPVNFSGSPQTQSHVSSFGDEGDRPPSRQAGERHANERHSGERNGFQPRGDRPYRQDHRSGRPFQDRNDAGSRDFRNSRNSRPPRDFRYREDSFSSDPQPQIEPAAAVLPSFITAAPRAVSLDVEDTPQAVNSVNDAVFNEVRAPVRRRRRSPYGAASEERGSVPDKDTNAD